MPPTKAIYLITSETRALALDHIHQTWLYVVCFQSHYWIIIIRARNRACMTQICNAYRDCRPRKILFGTRDIYRVDTSGDF